MKVARLVITMDAAEVLADVRRELAGTASPWKTRTQAAAHCKCSDRAIDELTARGILKRKYFMGSPRYHVDDLNALMTEEKVALYPEKAA